jgi:transcriptional regulator of heat shock response
MIDNLDRLFSEIPNGLGTRVFVGSESPIGKASGCSLIISELNSDYGRGYLGILGPMRMAYNHNLSAVKEIKNILEEENGNK